MRLSYKSIWVTAVILNLQFDISSVWKYLETLDGEIFKEYCLGFSRWNIAYKYMESRLGYPIIKAMPPMVLFMGYW